VEQIHYNIFNLLLLIIQHVRKVVPRPEVLLSIISGRCTDSDFIVGYLDVTRPIELLQWLQKIQRRVNEMLPERGNM
jgi:hypothetical protein